ncbi:MAG TPA: DUF3473 domain-containing protein [Thermodesulfobacteriota bacterium]|nr:DUF3473 domain-containing protein [Thermodesulfobacteriota bacterium]
MLNLLTIDVEDYFQVHAFSRVIRYDDWPNYECRIERNIDRVLEILDEAGQNSKFKTQNSKLNHSMTHSLNTSGSNDSVLSPQHSPKGSFFVLGWIAERYPGLVRKIQQEGHEIACHGYAHRLIYTQSKEEFRRDIRRAKSILEDVTGGEVIGYRAPSYSVTNKSNWAFEVLLEEGFRYDSSVFPIRHDFYGMPKAPRFPFLISLNGNSNVEFSMLNVELGTAEAQHRNTPALNNSLTHSPNNSAIRPQSSVLSPSGIPEPQHRITSAPSWGFTPNSELRTQHCLVEFPLSTVKLFGANFPISGGGYFRLLPYSLVSGALKGINEKENQPFIFYLHPWELDPEQPRIKGLSSRSKFRHYVNLGRTEIKFRKLLDDFEFSTIQWFLIQNS